MARALDHKPGLSLSGIATSAITSACVGVKFDTDKQYFVIAGAGEAIEGVTTTKLAAGEACEIIREGIVLGNLGGTVADGDYVTQDSAGKFVKQTAGTYVNGKALKGGASGEIGSIELCKPYLGRVVARGKAVLVAGTVTVSSTDILAADIVILTRQVTGGTVGHLTVGTIVPSTSFVIDCAVDTDTSTVAWMIVR